MDIMIINIKELHEEPLKKNSEIYATFDRDVIQKNPNGHLWYGVGHERSIIWKESLNFFTQFVDEIDDELDIWLLIGDFFWQKNSLLIRKKLEKTVLPKNYEPHAYKEILSSENKIKRISAFQLKQLGCYEIQEKLVNAYNVNLLAMPKNIRPEKFLKSCWSFNTDMNERTINFVIKEKGVIAKFFGKFDDIESGIMAFK